MVRLWASALCSVPAGFSGLLLLRHSISSGALFPLSSFPGARNTCIGRAGARALETSAPAEPLQSTCLWFSHNPTPSSSGCGHDGPLFEFSSLRALNTCIGSSGARALMTEPALHRPTPITQPTGTSASAGIALAIWRLGAALVYLGISFGISVGLTPSMPRHSPLVSALHRLHNDLQRCDVALQCLIDTPASPASFVFYVLATLPIYGLAAGPSFTWIEQQAQSAGCIFVGITMRFLISLLLRQVCTPRSRFGKACLHLLGRIPQTPLMCPHQRPGAQQTGSHRILAPVKPCHSQDDETAFRQRRPRVGLGQAFPTLMLCLFGFHNMPCAAAASTSWISTAGLVLCTSFEPVASMTTPQGVRADGSVGPGRLHSRPLRPHEIPIEEQVMYIGPAVPRPGTQHLNLPDDDSALPWVHVFDEAWAERPHLNDICNSAGADSWIGCLVYTPYVRPVSAAIRCKHYHQLHHCLAVILDSAPHADPYTYNVCIPTRPQLHSGMCTFLRFPSTARGGDSRPIVAVIVDLSCAGGHCYASYMSRATDYEDFMDFIYPQIRDDDQLVVYVGDNPDPVPPRRPLQLQDGDVISVRRTSYLAVPTAAAIVEDRSSWIPPHHVPQASQSEGVLVQYQDSQFFLQPYRHSGSTITEAIANRIGRPLSALTMCCFKTPDLELQGDWCGRLVMVVDLPPEQATACWRSRRRDVFILCDLRPVGQRMKIMHCHTPILHLPSVAALHHVYVPPYTRLTAIGGTVQGDEISTDGHSVLTFYLEPDSDDEDDTPGPGPPGPPRGRGTTSGPDDDSSEGDPPTSERPYRQSWPATDCSRRSRSRSADIPPGRHRGPQDCLDKALRTIFDREASEPGAMPPVEADAATVASVTDIMRSHGGHLDSHAYVACKGPAGPRLGTRATQVGEAAGQGRELAALEPETPYPAQPPDLQVEQPGQNLAEAVEDGRIEATCLIYAPGYVPDILAARLPIPCSVNHAVTQFVRGRDAGQAECFDQVFPASPQPAPNLAVLVASPSWMQDKVVVLFNCLAVNQMLFAAAVHPYLNKASILAAAGANLNGALREHGQLDVYIFGLLRPLDDAQWVTMRSGMSVCCVPAGQGPVPGWNLDDMLQDATDWTHNPALPGPPPAPGQHYLVLTDAMPYLFQVTPGRRRFLKQDVAQLLQCEAHSLSLVPTTPRVIDGISFGLPFWTVLVATEQLQTIPCPPARHPEHRLILILDCRAILLGFQWRLLTQPTVPAQELADQFADRCPASHLVVFRGADMHHSAEGLSLEVSHGQIIKVEFAAESAASSDSDAADDDPQGSDISMRSSEPPGTHTDASHDDLERLDSRSRSPRSGMPNPALGDDQPAPTASKVCTFGILAPGLSIESVVVSLSTPASMHDTVRALQTAREADYARALPLLQAVRHQPDTRWGLLIISVPIWGYTEAVVCIDMTSSWSRVFAVCLPVKASRPRVLAAAGLSAAADVDLFLNGDSPIEDFVDLHDGDCITVLWSGYGPSPRQDLADLLDGPWRTAAIPAFPTETEPDHYLLVGVDGCTWTALHRFITDVT